MISKWYYHKVPPKIRELMRKLEGAGFVDRGGRGSHSNYKHAQGVRITISGRPRDDAKPYQEKAVKTALKEALK